MLALRFPKVESITLTLLFTVAKLFLEFDKLRRVRMRRFEELSAMFQRERVRERERERERERLCARARVYARVCMYARVCVCVCR